MTIPSAVDFPGIDPTGARDCSDAIKAAHDAVAARGSRYLEFPAGRYVAPSLSGVGNVIFVGDGVLAGTYRKRIVPRHAPPGQPSHDDVVPSRHYRRFLRAVAEATPDRKASYLVAGDSTAEGGSPIAHSEQLVAVVRRRLIETFGAAANLISVESYGIGGTTWTDWASPRLRTGLVRHPWCADSPLGAVIARDPDAILWSLGQNDTGFFKCADMHRLVGAIRMHGRSRFGLPPDMVFLTPYAPALSDPHHGSRDEQEARDYVAGYIRTFAQRRGYGLIDQNRAAAMARDGFDVRTQTLMQVAGPIAAALPYSFPDGASDFGGEILFGDGDADLWSRGRLVLPLSARPGNALILERDLSSFRAAVTVDAAEGVPCLPRTLTPPHTPGGPMSVEWTVKGGHLRLTINGFEALDTAVERHGALFVPSIEFAGHGQPPTIRVLKALVGRPLTCMPDLLDREQFGEGQDDVCLPGGGNGRNHMSSYGIQRVLGQALGWSRFA